MAKDDYDVIAYKVLLYLYACLKRKIVYNEVVFFKSIKKEKIDDDYFDDVLRLLQGEGLIEGLQFVKVWGSSYMLISDYADMNITADGIHYLKDNSKMQEVKNFLFESKDLMVPLIGLVLPYVVNH